ncbi:MAG: hypothetical protein P8I61_04395 [Opitutae bacterium]|nr:hypothetical protein [Opitutae bacterium]
MLKQIIQFFTVLYFSIILSFFTACQPTDISKKTLIGETTEFLEKGNPQAAINLLETQMDTYGQDIDILQLLAQSYLESMDPFTATVILLNAYELEPENANTLDLYLKSLKAANMDITDILLEVAQTSPASLNKEEWQQASALFENQGNTEAALNAYFEYLGTKKASKSTSPEAALKIGEYYLELKQTKEAQAWLSISANSDSIEALPAQLKLITIELQKKDWSALMKQIERIEKQFPDALASTSFADLPKIVAEKLEAKKQASLFQSKNPTTSDKAGSIQNIEDLEAYANQVAKPFLEKAEAINASPTEFNPDIEIEPADPYLSNFDTAELDEAFDQTTMATLSQIKLTSQEIEALIAEANRSVLSNDLDTAAALYREVLDDSPQRHEIWDRIAQVYFANEEYNSAESAALDAIRYQPSNIAYTINYLNIAKKTKSEIRFLSELLSASKQFTNSPEIALSLARAYDRNSRYRFKAKDYYTKFITLAPNHPQRPEAEAAISRLP